MRGRCGDTIHGSEAQVICLLNLVRSSNGLKKEGTLLDKGQYRKGRCLRLLICDPKRKGSK